jgi:hypothetical protein
MGEKNKDIATSGMTAVGFLWRLAVALVLVLVTYNPSGHSAWHWIGTALGPDADFGPLHLLLIGVLAAGWAVFWIATWRALGALGSVIAGLIVCAIIWLFYDIGLLESNSVSAITWIALVALAFVLAVGVSWSHLWRRITGQFNVEDVND